MIDRRILAPAIAGLLAVVAVAWALFAGGPRYDLRWKFRAGEILEYRTVMQCGSEGNETCTIFETRFTVVSVSPEGTAELTSLVERALVRKGGPDGPLVWDSSSGHAAPRDFAIAFVVAVTGVPIKMTVDVRGRVLSAEGTDVVRRRMREILGGDFFGFMDILFSGKGDTFCGPALPESPIRRGERWNVDFEIGTPAWGITSRNDEYVLQDVREGVAVLSSLGSRNRTTPGEVQKALGDAPPDPNAAFGIEEEIEFSIEKGAILSEKDRRWTQGTLTSGKLFRFEGRSRTVLMERRPP